MTEYVLEILDGDRAGDIIELDKPPLTLGRRPSNDVALRDEKVSGEHAVVDREGDQWVLRDVGSTNGTLLDGRRVDEIGLTANDVFQVGRVHIAFKERGAPTPRIGGPEMTVRTLDREELLRTRRGGGVGVLLGVVVLLGAAAGYWFFLREGGETGGGPRSPRKVVQVAGNLLAAGTDMEAEGGWDVGVSGAPFTFERGRANAHTGTGYLVARRDAETKTSHAVARTTKDQIAAAGNGLRATAWLKTRGAAKAAVRLRLWSTRDASVLTTGSTPASYEGYTEVSCAAGVPPGFDRVEVEVVALLPAAGGDAESGSEVMVDDVALVEDGAAKAHDIQTSAGLRLAGAGGAVVLRGVESTVLSGILPITSDPALRELERAGLLCLSDAGGTLEVADDESALVLKVGGATGLRLMFDAGLAAAGVLARAGGAPFVPHGGEFELAAAEELLLGYGPARLLVRGAAPGPMRGELDKSRFALALPQAAQVSLVYGFKTERERARVLLEEARRSFRDGDFKGVSTKVREAVQFFPHDDAQYKELTQLRAKVRTQQGDATRTLEAELEKAVYFDSLAGYRRLRSDLAELVRVYGEEFLLEKEKIQAMRDKVEQTITRIEADEGALARKKLGVLVKVYEAAGEKDMAKMIQGYISTLPESGGDGEDK